MKLNHLEEQSFALAELNTYDLTELSINKETALKELREDLVSEIEDLNSEETKNSRFDHFKVKGVSPNDYSEKLLKLDDDKSIVYGIRNMGGNPNIPFIQIIPNFDISSKEMSLKIYERIKNDFKAFGPLYLSFHTRTRINADFFGSIYMVAKTIDLAGKKPWPIEDRISFVDINDNSYYKWYKNGYDEFHSDFPGLKEKVTVNGESSMTDSLEQGLLKFVEIDGERIGLIAGEKSELLGHSSVYFHEIYISKKWKGKGIAKAIQRKFIALFANELEYVWGTIDSSNLPSYKTAYSNGRRPIRHECFINLK
jgi:hypothetical protein